MTYPALRRVAAWFVDKIVLKRADYADLLIQLSRQIDLRNSPEAMFDEALQILSPALSARMDWMVWNQPQDMIVVQADRRRAQVPIATTEAPRYVLHIRDLASGRRLLSDDVAMLERAALLIARRIDAVRSIEERYRHDVREQEMRKLAAEAELKALRAQINPHFLFNALTTIGYLIQTAPERALETLMRLSGLLRAVLKSADEFVPLGEELDLVEAYLDIERARFEDRLRVLVDVPFELRKIRIPALVIQPLVENSIKHGISESLTGGEVRISARLEELTAIISVIDTGAGANDLPSARQKSRGLGLSNVQKRLERYGSLNAVTMRSTQGAGTTVELRIPVDLASPAEISSGARLTNNPKR
jgi:sensor histidine kinase YesM